VCEDIASRISHRNCIAILSAKISSKLIKDRFQTCRCKHIYSALRFRRGSERHRRKQEKTDRKTKEVIKVAKTENKSKWWVWFIIGFIASFLVRQLGIAIMKKL
jgi:hypothetical protein